MEKGFEMTTFGPKRRKTRQNQEAVSAQDDDAEPDDVEELDINNLR